MKYVKSHYNEKTGEWKKTIVEEENDLVFFTTTDFPIEKLKQNKKENEIRENENKNEIRENKE
ncbi:MAG: hypothetical protein XD75_0061 [Parcubacteria bacterium 33_209]|nr:MAG: hypothetical protein XD75_0061 [Parcubacteria bacterium 33_209]